MAKTGSTFFQLYFSTFTLTGSIMKCPKCNYTSFDYLTECRKCGQLLDEVRKRLNLQVSKPVLNIDETMTPEVENQVEDAGLEMQEADLEDNEENMLAGDDEHHEGEELIAVSSTMGNALPPLEGLGSMESLRDAESPPVSPDELPPVEENLEMAAAFNPSDEQLENLSIQEESAVEDEELPELDAEISDEQSNDTLEEDEDYDSDKVIELSEEDQIFDLELDLEDDKGTSVG